MLTVDEYVARLTAAQRAAFERVYKAVKAVVPDADVSIGYGMPVFKYGAKPLIYFGAFKKHMTIFPGTIRFTENDPPAEDQIKEIVLDRLIDITGRDPRPERRT
jgi:uncharacterized protein YdhG (YjbR/CyaY superfamily)